MKRIQKLIFVLGLFTFLGFGEAHAQRFAYVDTDYILEKIPEYNSAQKQLESLTKEWQKEIQNRISEIDKLYQDYQSEKVLLPEEEKKKREQAIIEKEKALNRYKEEKFGPEGELYKKRQELVKPIQDRVFEAVQELAKEEQLDIILDKSGAVSMLYTNAKYDRSDEVLELMDVKPVKDNSDN